MNHQPIIFSTAKATKGIVTPQEIKRGGFLGWIKGLVKSLSWYELVWYLAFFVSGILCLALLPFSFMLLVSVFSLYFYMVSINLISSGKRLGLVVGVSSSLVYVLVCFFNGVWGEVASNLLLFIPLNLYTFFKWGRLKSNNENHEQTLAVTSMGLWDWWFSVCVLGMGIIGLGLFLDKVTHQAFAFVNSASIMLNIMGMLVRMQGKREVWWFYFGCDACAISLWALVSLGEGLSTLPIMLSSCAALLNDVIGMVKWQSLLKKNQVTTGNYLAKGRNRVDKIVCLKRQMQHFVWTSATDANWEQRLKDKSQKENEVCQSR